MLPYPRPDQVYGERSQVQQPYSYPDPRETAYPVSARPPAGSDDILSIDCFGKQYFPAVNAPVNAAHHVSYKNNSPEYVTYQGDNAQTVPIGSVHPFQMPHSDIPRLMSSEDSPQMASNVHQQMAQEVLSHVHQPMSQQMNTSTYLARPSHAGAPPYINETLAAQSAASFQAPQLQPRQPHHAAFAVASSSTPDRAFSCKKCPEKFPDKAALRMHNNAAHLGLVCTYPGCMRPKDQVFSHDSAFRRHMREIHGIDMESDREKRRREANSLNRLDQDERDAMLEYLTGAGSRLPSDVRLEVRNRSRGYGPADQDLPDDDRLSMLEDENKRLGSLVDKLVEELRAQRAVTEVGLQEAEERRVKELWEMWRSHQQELKTMRGGADESFDSYQRQVMALSEELKANYDKEMRAVQNRHQKNERRLWNLLSK